MHARALALLFCTLPIFADSATARHADSATHWAFQSVAKTSPHASIDAFIDAKLQETGLQRAAEAERATLLRRLSYTLTGLPPSIEDIQAFLADSAPGAYAKAIDRLLASPRYGEHWGRHWLDIARYADTRGYVTEDSNLYPYAYTYRDYVIRALNADLPYNSFVRQQIAADLIGASQQDQAALGFLTVGRRFLNRRHLIIDDRIDLITRGLMGLTVACARCHDHKYDPVPISDYYSLYGVFDSCDEPKDLPLVGPPADTPEYRAFSKELTKRQAAVDAKIANELKAHIKEMHDRAAEYVVAATRLVHDQSPNPKDDAFARKPITTLNRRIIRRFAEFLKKQPKKHASFGLWHEFVHKPPATFAKSAAKKKWANAAPPKNHEEFAQIMGQVFADAKDQFFAQDRSPTDLNPGNAHLVFETKTSNAIRKLRRKIVEWRATGAGAPPRAMIMADRARPSNSAIHLRGDPGSKGERVPRQFLAVLAGNDRQPFKEGSGRRELADAIIHPDNPLTARVFVNRVWALHFGAGLVRELDDFGVRGSPPSHPELLDYLARRFVEQGWSLKALHREILLSATWRQRSDLDNPAAALADPENRLLWRMNRQRLSWEAYRDSMLLAAGALDRKFGGRSVDMFKAPFSRRRAVYGIVDRQDLPGELRHFDFASPDTATASRPRTTVPQQALFAMNSPFVAEFAGVLSQRSPGDNAAFVSSMYRHAFAREPSADERAQSLQFLTADPIWQYGYGNCSAEAKSVSDFRALPFIGDYYRGSEKMPDPVLSYVLLNATGGHPGKTTAVSAVRRWTAPAAGILRIRGEIHHPSDQGDGVRGRILSGNKAQAVALVHNDKARLDAEFAIQAGQTVDFVIDCVAYESWDNCSWAPTLTLHADGKQIGAWDATADFAGPDHQARAEFAQVLLMSNEFMFVD
jgi:hypothetical protein